MDGPSVHFFHSVLINESVNEKSNPRRFEWRSAFALALLARPGGGHGRRGGEWAPARPSAGSLLLAWAD